MHKVIIELDNAEKSFQALNDIIDQKFKKTLLENYKKFKSVKRSFKDFESKSYFYDRFNSYAHFREEEGYNSYIRYIEDGYSSWKEFLKEKNIFQNNEISEIIKIIKEKLFVRLYHGCRIENFDSYKTEGLKTFSAESANANIAHYLKMKGFEKELIQKSIDGVYNNNGCYFSTSLGNVIKFGGVYIVFGSEYRLRVLNAVNSSLRESLFEFGVPSILVFDIALKLIDSDQVFEYLIELWSKKHLKINGLRTFSELKLINEFWGYPAKGEVKITSSIDFCYFNKVIIPQRKLIKVNDHFDSTSPASYQFNQICKKSELKKLEDILLQKEILYKLI